MFVLSHGAPKGASAGKITAQAINRTRLRRSKLIKLTHDSIFVSQLL